MIRAALLDLDDTLYDERTYVLSGFRAVAGEISRRIPGVRVEPLVAGMMAEMDAHGRGAVFDRTLQGLGLAADPALIAELVAIYRGHRPDIELWPGVADALMEIRQAYRTAIVTDGLPLMQRRKVEALGLAPLVEHVLYCWEHDAPKPDPACHIEAAARLGVGIAEVVVVGDRPDHDIAAARAAGCHSIRVLTGRFARTGDGMFAADVTVPDFAGVPAILRSGKFGAPA